MNKEQGTRNKERRHPNGNPDGDVDVGITQKFRENPDRADRLPEFAVHPLKTSWASGRSMATPHVLDKLARSETE